MMPPGPRTPVLWQTFRFVTRPKEHTRKMQRLYGDAVKFHSLAGEGIAVFEATLAREVFAAPADTFEVVEVVPSLFGARAVIATSGALHKRQRKLLNPPFHGPRIKALLGTMQRVVRRHLEPLATQSGVVRMADIAQAMTLDVILETVFGSGSSTSVDLERGREILRDIIHSFSPVIMTSKKFHTPLFPPWRRQLRARSAFDGWVDGLITARRRKGEHGEDLLGLFLSTRYEDGDPIPDAEIRDHLITLLLAGHETSAIAISWATYWLLREPRVLLRLREEIDALGPSPSVEALARLPYLGAVGSESLRIEPVVTDVLRKCRVPMKLREWTIPAGGCVAVMLGAILEDPRIFPEPERFRPERFLERSFHAGEFLPFGGGQRRCLGAAFAEAELAIAIATIASEWELELADDRPERAVRRNITMGPARGVRIRVAGRRKS
jgi:cytochrome P450 family 110